ncbi:uncharacterized protein BDW47DRAFT_38816 [Aspergillus candidus]|uniref:Uncharacterized protein n=1 Tax=Aspergillus candidus TaxID=41067 RepID=A0A2I2F9D0_ASPCN|nr:hypothetical protein BDW47DRAFT_38816 [Aspergillus candidus]PLB37244.1 hypothetical protein BDW47DRAFT_38816 [Aspergillus candidus]
MAVARGAAACGLRGHVAPESTCQRHIGLERPHPARARLGSMGPLDPEVCWMIRKVTGPTCSCDQLGKPMQLHTNGGGVMPLQGERFSTDVYVTSIIQLPYQPTWPPTTTLRIYDCDLDAAPDQASCPGMYDA